MAKYNSLTPDIADTLHVSLRAALSNRIMRMTKCRFTADTCRRQFALQKQQKKSRRS